MLITPEELDRMQDRERFLDAIREGVADADAGRVVDDEDLEAALDRLDRE